MKHIYVTQKSLCFTGRALLNGLLLNDKTTGYNYTQNREFYLKHSGTYFDLLDLVVLYFRMENIS